MLSTSESIPICIKQIFLPFPSLVMIKFALLGEITLAQAFGSSKYESVLINLLATTCYIGHLIV